MKRFFEKKSDANYSFSKIIEDHIQSNNDLFCDDQKGSLKARFKFAWVEKPEVNLTTVLTLYGFKVQAYRVGFIEIKS